MCGKGNERNRALHGRFKWNIHKITRYDIEDFEHYLRNEKSLSEQYPKQFEAILEKYPAEINVVHIHTKLQDRGDNTIIKLKKKFKAFMQWLYDNQLTTNRPFDGVKIGVEKYGVPFYLWKEERNIVAEADLHEEWKMLSDEDKKTISEKSLSSLSAQRDIFVFQCLVGCRVGDLERLNSRNITNGILEYVPSKTMDEDAPVKPRIPLNKTAISLVNKYGNTFCSSIYPATESAVPSFDFKHGCCVGSLGINKKLFIKSEPEISACGFQKRLPVYRIVCNCKTGSFV